MPDNKKQTSKLHNDYASLQSILPFLPYRSYAGDGRVMEPVNLLVIGSQQQIHELFKALGWLAADRISVWSVARALASTAFNKPYPTGPTSKAYVSGKPQQLSYQLPTASKSFRRRHHLRLWPTPFKLDGARTWVGTLSYDKSIGLKKDSLLPTHHISPDLFSEEEFLARSLGKNCYFIKTGRAEASVISTGDDYFWNGRVLVIEAAKYQPQ